MNFPCTCSSSVKTLLAHLSLTTHPQDIKPKLCMHLENKELIHWAARYRSEGCWAKAPLPSTHTSKPPQMHPLLSSCTPTKKTVPTEAWETLHNPLSTTGTNLEAFRKSRWRASKTAEILDFGLNWRVQEGGFCYSVTGLPHWTSPLNKEATEGLIQ